MKAYNLIIVSSGRADRAPSGHLRKMVQTCTSMSRNPILVVGPDGDELLLREGDALDACDLVFDPNFEGNFFSSLKAGLQASHGATLVATVEAPLSPTQVKALEAAAFNLKDDTVDVIRLMGTDGGSQSFKLALVTPRGVTKLKALPADTLWESSPAIVFSDLVETPSSDS